MKKEGLNRICFDFQKALSLFMSETQRMTDKDFTDMSKKAGVDKEAIHGYLLMQCLRFVMEQIPLAKGGISNN